MRDIHVVFFERALIEEHQEAFSGGQLAFCVLSIDALLPSAQTGLLATNLELVENGSHQRQAFVSGIFPAVDDLIAIGRPFLERGLAPPGNGMGISSRIALRFNWPAIDRKGLTGCECKLYESVAIRGASRTNARPEVAAIANARQKTALPSTASHLPKACATRPAVPERRKLKVSKTTSKDNCSGSKASKQGGIPRPANHGRIDKPEQRCREVCKSHRNRHL
ncbi:hypothetical protein MesoLj131c_68700 (plasmid) [Mesorhizobium sp. 131-3-5]|nr:hypothetical protein MesoLj131c_68700 [Mesorhizobium sp. 131-3-5]